jgi:hypothetical protein
MHVDECRQTAAKPDFASAIASQRQRHAAPACDCWSHPHHTTSCVRKWLNGTQKGLRSRLPIGIVALCGHEGFKHRHIELGTWPPHLPRLQHWLLHSLPVVVTATDRRTFTKSSMGRPSSIGSLSDTVSVTTAQGEAGECSQAGQCGQTVARHLLTTAQVEVSEVSEAG